LRLRPVNAAVRAWAFGEGREFLILCNVWFAERRELC